jgi:hypothetical protein
MCKEKVQEELRKRASNFLTRSGFDSRRFLDSLNV